MWLESVFVPTAIFAMSVPGVGEHTLERSAPEVELIEKGGTCTRGMVALGKCRRRATGGEGTKQVSLEMPEQERKAPIPKCLELPLDRVHCYPCGTEAVYLA